VTNPWLRPRLSLVKFDTTKRLLGLGSLFFAFQLAQIVGFQSDNIVLAHILGAGKVPVYAITTRMFSVVALLMNFVIAPLWPAYGEAFAREDITWLKRTLRRSIVLVLVICIPTNIVLVLSGKWLLSTWVGPQISPSWTLLLGIGLSQTIMAIVTPLSVFLNGLNVLGKQAIFASLMALTNITASIYLTRRIGVPGVIYGSVIAESLFFLLPFALLVRSTLAHLPAKMGKSPSRAEAVFNA
jgi:O-antigen/teichoic acid export membrane protein